MKIPASQRFPRLTKSLKPRAAGDKNILIFGARIKNSFEIGLPPFELMNLVKNEEVRVERPAPVDNDSPVLRGVEVKVLGPADLGHDLFGEVGFPYLPRPRNHDHFLGKVL